MMFLNNQDLPSLEQRLSQDEQYMTYMLDTIEEKNPLYHELLFRELNLYDDSAKIPSLTMYIDLHQNLSDGVPEITFDTLKSLSELIVNVGEEQFVVTTILEIGANSHSYANFFTELSEKYPDKEFWTSTYKLIDYQYAKENKQNEIENIKETFGFNDFLTSN